MVKKQKGPLIPEEKYNTDFRPITGFYDFHIKKKVFSTFFFNLYPQYYTVLTDTQNN